jgi:hypothetical protein
LWRHEVAVCNGWRGYRSLGDDSLVIQMDKELKREEKKREKAEKKNPPQRSETCGALCSYRPPGYYDDK